jgi:hypothetical protein
MSSTTGGTETAVQTTVTGTNQWVEVVSRAATLASVTAIGSPSGKGWVYAPGNGTFATGNWSATVTLSASAPGTTDVTIRFYKYSGGTYTSIGTINKTGITGTKTSYSFAATSFSSVTFASSDLLYCDLWWHDTSGADDNPNVYVSNSATAGVVNDFVVTTSSLTSVTTSSRTIPTSAALLSLQLSRTVPTSAALLSSQLARTIPTNASVANEFSRVIPTSAALDQPSSRTIPTSAALSSSQLPRTISTSAALLSSQLSRNVPTSAALLSSQLARTIPTSASLSLELNSGGFALFANTASGTVSFDSVRWTQYPDPALSLGPVLPRLGSSLVSWNDNLPGSTTDSVSTSLDGINFTPATNGSSIPGLTGQPDPIIDLFNTDTHLSYTTIGGASWTEDTANSRITASGGVDSLYLYSAVSASEIDVMTVMDKSDAGGLVWNYTTNNYYELVCFDDSSSSGTTNQLKLYRIASGVRTQIGSSVISWARSTLGSSPYKTIRVTMLKGVITVYFDGTALITYTDGSPLSAGLCGLRNDGGTSRYYQLRIGQQGQYVSGNPQGDIVTGQFIYTQTTLNTSDPATNPQQIDLFTSARSPLVGTGGLVKQLHDPTKPFATFFNDEMTTLAQTSLITGETSTYWWHINSSDSPGTLTFTSRQTNPAPFALYSSDFLYQPSIMSAGGSSAGATGVKASTSADLYRNRQTIINVTGLKTINNEEKIADGTATSWSLAYPLHSAPTITVQGVTKTVGVLGVDSAKDFYYQVGSTSVSQDTSATILQAGYILSFSYVGEYPTSVTVDNTAEQAIRKSIEGGTGIVESVFDGQGITADDAQTYAQGLLAQYGNNDTIEILAVTSRPGLKVGMLVSMFIPEHNINNVQLLIVKVSTGAYVQVDGTVKYEFMIDATNGANLNNWSTVFENT